MAVQFHSLSLIHVQQDSGDYHERYLDESAANLDRFEVTYKL